MVYGGGAMEMALANAVLEFMKTVEGKEGAAVEAFAKAGAASRPHLPAWRE